MYYGEYELDMIRYNSVYVNGTIEKNGITDTEILLVSEPSQKNKYHMHHGFIAFVDKNGGYYVSPYGDEKEELLKSFGFVEDTSIHVPFANGSTFSTDKHVKSQWDELYTTMRRIQAQDPYRRIRESLGLKKLPEKAYEISIKIPKEGLILDGGEIIRPIPDWEIRGYIGKFCEENGTLAFVDDFGNMYVTPFSVDMKDALTQLGYTAKEFSVPLSNGERINDPELQSKWDRFRKASSELAQKRANQKEEPEISAGGPRL